MSKKTIVDKNFALSASFTDYVIKHPEITEHIPKNACLIFEDKSDEYLTRKNRKIAREITKEKGEKCFSAIKENNKWTVLAFS